jgi:hypothetical protein
MHIEESRVFQVATFGTLHLHQGELDESQVDAQLMDTVRSLMEAKPAESAA